MAIGCHWGEFAMLLSPLFYRYYYTWELYVFPCSKQVTYAQVALLSGKCSGPVGLAVGVHFVCSPQGGSQHTLSECLVSLPLVIPRENLLRVSTKGKLLDDGSLCGACFGSGSLQDSLARGAIQFCRYLVLPCHLPKNISFPSIEIIAA
jgi:hypothetical protein